MILDVTYACNMGCSHCMSYRASKKDVVIFL